MQFISLLFVTVMLLFPTSGASQSLRPAESKAQKDSEKNAPVPKEYLPPPGMCRIWVDNVPANRQPAPTDCATAIRNRPPNARVIFPPGKAGEQKAAPGRGRPDTTKRKPPNEGTGDRR
jgi:hypothetical protein